jgi:threonine dehydratase
VQGLIQLDAIRAARERIHGQIHRTPTLPSRQLGRRFGIKLCFKAELIQKTGSFKVRGVLNKLHGLPADARERGFVSMSAGNHAAALSWASSTIGAPSVIVMPEGAARSKLDATRGYGGEVVLTRGDLMQACDAVRDERGMTMVHPFDDPAIMAGHGTLGLEIVEDLPDLDLLIVPVGGGGLIGGTAAAVKAMARASGSSVSSRWAPTR